MPRVGVCGYTPQMMTDQRYGATLSELRNMERCTSALLLGIHRTTVAEECIPNEVADVHKPTKHSGPFTPMEQGPTTSRRPTIETHGAHSTA